MELKELLKNIAVEFERNDLGYMIIGGQAVLLYGEPRLTKDIDITVDGGLEKFDVVMKIATDLGLKLLVENPRQFAEQTLVLPFLDEETGLRVDFIFAYSPYEKEAMKRINRVQIEDVYVNYISVEDLIIHKIVSGREKDIEDVKKILFQNKNIDEKYILKWLKEFEKIMEAKLVDVFLQIKKKAEK